MTEIHKKVNQRIKELSDFLGIDDSIVTTTSIVFGLYKYLLSYQKQRDLLYKESIYKKTDEIDKFKDNLKSQIESDYDMLKDLGETEDYFESKYQDKIFTTLEEWRNEFLTYLESPIEQEIEQVEAITKEKELIAPVLKKRFTREKPEKIKIKKERLELPVKLLPKEKVGMYLFFPSVLFSILFMSI